MPSPLHSYSQPTSLLTDGEISQLYRLFDAYYEDTTLDNFLHDLENKNWIVIIKDAQKSIVGFSTLAFYSSRLKEKEFGVVYSGDTIIEKAFWGTPELPRQWIKTVLEVGKEYPNPLYWLLISSGYKTYRFLTVFFKEYYPRFETITPSWAQDLMDHLAEERFGPEYIQARGIVRFSMGATPLKKGIADLDSWRLKDDQIRFFLEKNPGHIHGDELVCLTMLHPANFSAAGKRMAR